MASGIFMSGLWELILVVVLGGGFGLPLGLPPLPEDPTLSRVAPEECVWYYSWSGVSEATLKSKNKTEQLLAEPEVQNFFHLLGTEIGNGIKKGAPPTPEGQVLGEEGPKLLQAAITHSAAVFISNVAMGHRGPEITGGIVVSTGEQTAEINASLLKIEKMLLGAKAVTGDDQWHKLPTPPDAPKLEWGVRGKYLILGIGTGSADAILKRTTGEAPAWLTKLKQKLPVERVSTVHYLNLHKVLQVVGPFLGGRDGELLLSALGISNIQTLGSVSGLEGTGFVSKSTVQITGEATGLLSFFGPEPLKPAELAPIPPDASFALAARIQPARLFAAYIQGLNKVDPGAAERFAGELEKAENFLGFHLKDDLLNALGDAWCVYNSPGEGGLLVTGLTVVVPAKDHDRLAKTNETLVKILKLSMARDAGVPGNGSNNIGSFRRRRTEIRDTKFQGQTIYYLNTIGEEMPIAPAWCVTDKYVILSLSPQNVRAFLSRDPQAGSLADLPVVANRLKSNSPVVLTYQDTAATLKTVYPVLQIIGNIVSGEIQREGLDITPAAWPSLPSLLKHIEPGVGSLSQDKDGLTYIDQQSLPSGGMTALLPAVFTGMFWVRARPFEEPLMEDRPFPQLEVPQSIPLEPSTLETLQRKEEPVPGRKIFPDK